ncbi:MAG: hypothetical protein C0405_12610 [Desulfovibrio sp.]|nr:hypothetical protein [Desulfovibrio sp.]
MAPSSRLYSLWQCRCTKSGMVVPFARGGGFLYSPSPQTWKRWSCQEKSCDPGILRMGEPGWPCQGWLGAAYGTDTMTPLSSRLERKLRRLSAVLPVLLGALAITALLALAAWLARPYLPKAFVDFLSEFLLEDFEGRKNALKAWFDSWGAVAAWVFLCVQFLQVVLAPIPGQFVGMVGGFVFGFWRGLALNLVGNAIGSLTAMLLTRFFGERVMRPFVPLRIQEKFDATMHRGGLENFFMLFLLPGTPKDAICFMAGLTRFPIWKLLLVNTLGRLPGLVVLTFTGAAIEANLLAVKLVFGAGLALALLAWLFDEELKERLARLTG